MDGGGRGVCYLSILEVEDRDIAAAESVRIFPPKIV